MKILPSIILVLIVLMCSSMPMRAANYYFSVADGDDSRSFSQAQNPATPWQSLQKFNEIFPNLDPGDQVFFKRGEVFKGSMLINNSGSVNQPIRISAYGDGDKPIISGFQSLHNWTHLGNGKYESEAFSVDSPVQMVVINGVNYAMGRYPNRDAENGGYLTLETHGSNYINDHELPSSPNWAGAELVLRNQRWILDRAPITSHQGNSLYFNSSVIDYGPTNGFGYFIQNDIRTLDQFGEWYFNPSSNKLTVYFGTEPSGNQTVQAASIDRLITLQASNVVFENLAIMGANEFAMYNEYYSVHNVKVQNCDIAFSGWDAIRNTTAHNFWVENCSISNTNSNAINLQNGAIDSKIRNNHISNTGVHPGMGESGDGTYQAIYAPSKGLMAERNTIINTGYIAINFGGDFSVVRNNFIDTFCTLKDDGGGIYSYMGSDNNTLEGQQVISNIVLNGVGAPEGTNYQEYIAAEGIYLDDNVNHVEVRDNTIAFCENHGIFIHNARDFSLIDNTLFANRTQLSTLGDAGSSGSITDASISGNIFFSKMPSSRVASFLTSFNDISQIGDFNDNYYCRPMNEELTILTIAYLESSYDMSEYNLTGWQQEYNQDMNSHISPFSLPAYQVDSLYGSNIVENGYFENGISQVECNNGCDASWEQSSNLDGGAVEVTTGNGSQLHLYSEGIEDGTQYVLKFSAESSEEFNVDVALRQINQPWHTLSNQETVVIKPGVGNYQVIFTAESSMSSIYLEFYHTDNNITYWLDNIELFEADVSPTNPDNHIRFEYNAGDSPMTIPLDGDYVDVSNVAYSGSITLQPFESMILLRPEAGNGNGGGDLLVSPIVNLEGAFDPSTGLMHDNLRTSGVLPLNEPYTELDFTQVGGGGESIPPLVLNITGPDAVVDWIFLELRDKSDSTVVLGTRAALLQRDGDIVDEDGVSPVAFAGLPADEYYLVIKHRNHTGAMSAQPIALSATKTVVDFTNDLSLIFGGSNGIANLGNGHLALFSGDINGNGQIQNTDYSILVNALGASGYTREDLDLNNQIQNTDLHLKLIPNLSRGQAFPQ